MRADFYSHCLDHPRLSRALESNLYNLSLISSPQIRDNIEKRLALAGSTAEDGLMDSLLADAGSEPGNLALLEHALAQLWQKDGVTRKLLNNTYAKIGRLQGALARHADEVYANLREPEQELARKVFLELVQLGEDAPDTRRLVPMKDLLVLGQSDQVEALLMSLASSRLISTSGVEERRESYVEVSHEALIREWPRLREWMRQNRDELHIRRQLLQTAKDWKAYKKDPADLLLRGGRLETAEAWLSKNPDAPELVRDFIVAGTQARNEAAREKEEAQQRELAREHDLRRAAEEQLAQNYWQRSRSAYASGDDSKALHFAVKAICLAPALRDTLLLDLRDIQSPPCNRSWIMKALLRAPCSVKTRAASSRGVGRLRAFGTPAPDGRLVPPSSIKARFGAPCSVETRAAFSPGVETRLRASGTPGPGGRLV